MTLEEKLKNWKVLFKFLEQHTPSSPAWFHAIDGVVSALVAERISELESVLPSTERSEP